MNPKAEELARIFPLHLRGFCQACFQGTMQPEEIRMRIGQPILSTNGNQEQYWNATLNKLTDSPQNAYRAQEQDFSDMLAYMSNYSLYAFEEDIKGGFLTIQGGHRIGLAGRVMCEKGMIKTMRQISFLNIRVASERKGCADVLLPYVRKAEMIYNTLIISPPGVGKTTVLRDIIRQLSRGEKEKVGLKVGVVDERSEIAACYLGQPQNDVGPRTDVMDCCPKTEGMLLLLRSMSPQVIAVDELGTAADFDAVAAAFHCGCFIIGTIHGDSMADMLVKPQMNRWIEKGFFERYIVIQRGDDKKRRYHIFNERLEQIC
jgi:stage III sporulation protein AA